MKKKKTYKFETMTEGMLLVRDPVLDNTVILPVLFGTPIDENLYKKVKKKTDKRRMDAHTRAKISQAVRNSWKERKKKTKKTRSEIMSKAITNWHKRRGGMSEETKRKIGEANRKTWRTKRREAA